MNEDVEPESKKHVENALLMHKYLSRCDKILRHATNAFDILDTMDGSDFLDFRDYLGDGSGFQSTQFRELEFLLGLNSLNRAAVISKSISFYLSYIRNW